MPELEYPEWQEPYQQAMLELDPAKLRQKILNAEAAIYKRLLQLSDGEAHVDGASEEKSAIHDAIAGLRAVVNPSMNASFSVSEMRFQQPP